MTTSRSHLIDIAGELRHETDLAYLLFDGIIEVWIPKSLVEYDGHGTFTLPEWLAKQEGLI